MVGTVNIEEIFYRFIQHAFFILCCAHKCKLEILYIKTGLVVKCKRLSCLQNMCTEGVFLDIII